MYYKLIDPFDTSVRLYLPHKQGSGIKHEAFILYPKKKYDEYVDDEVFMEALLSAYKDIPYSEERKKVLEEYGAKFEEHKCTPCQGRVKKLKVWFAEVCE